MRLGTEGDWIDTALVEELVDQDGELLTRASADEILGETPWDATFEAAVDLPSGPQRIEISVSSPAEGIDTPIVLDDWQTD